jgi:hypothetical protein
MPPYAPGGARVEVEIEPPLPLTPAQTANQKKAAAIALQEQAVEAIKGKAPWPFERESL